jgi:hypothetical protein
LLTEERAVWTTLQDQYFLIGAALVAISHAVKFGELNSADPVTGRYIALLPGAKVRDFAGPYAYHMALAAFLGVSLTAYFFVCQISPDILKGAAGFFGGQKAQQAIEGVAYPLYVAALFVGLTQPIVPVFARVGDVQRDFFHDQIEVPRRVIDLAERLTIAIQARAGADKRRLAKEVRNLAGGEVLSSLQTQGDLAYYKLQLDKLDIGDPAALEKTIKGSSARELRGLIERLVLCTLVAVMRRSGSAPLDKIAESVGVSAAAPPRFNNLGYFLASVIASGLLFSVCLLMMAYFFALLADPIATLFGRAPDKSLWPSDLDNVVKEFWYIVPPIFVCLIVAVRLLVPSEQAQTANSGQTPDWSPKTDLVNFFHEGASVLGLCMVVTILIKMGQMFYEYGNISLPGNTLETRLILPVVQSLIPVAVCLFTTWYLVSGRHRGFSFMWTLLVIAGAVGFFTILYDLTFLREYLRSRPEYAPGLEHLLFAVVANALISICAFVSVALFFKSHIILRQPPAAFRRRQASMGNGGEPPRRFFHRARRSSQASNQRKPNTQNSWHVGRAG